MRGHLQRHATGWVAWAVGALLAGCASGLPSDTTAADPALRSIQASDWALQSRIGQAAATSDWQHKTFGDRKPTVYRPAFQAGRAAIHALSEAGNSSLRREVAHPPGIAVGRLRFSWLVGRLNEAADLRDSDIDDAVARVVLSFDGDRAARFSTRDHMLSELAQLITGEGLPYATLIYVWDNRYPVGTVIANPHTDRIRQMVVETGPDRLGRWVDHERDVQADFRHAFGENAGTVLSVGVMSDTNNTGASVEAWFGPLQLSFSEPAEVSPSSSTTATFTPPPATTKPGH